MKTTLILFLLSFVAGRVIAEPYEVNAHAQRSKYRCVETEPLPIKALAKGKSTTYYELCIHQSFDAQEEKILRQSFGRMVAQLIDPRTFKCLGESVSSGSAEGRALLASPQAFLNKLVMTPLSIRKFAANYVASLVFVSPLEESKANPQLHAEGYLNYFEDPKLDADGREFFKHISLAVKKSSLTEGTNPVAQDLAFWSSVLSIAFLKNMGTADSASPKAGRLSHELAKCVFWAGSVPAVHSTFKKVGGVL